MEAIKEGNKEKTTIQVLKSTRDKLQSLAVYGDSMDTVIQRLLNGHKPKEKGETGGG